jgi:glycogen debranching enzyme
MVLRVVRERLLTPMGLRTLAPNEPAYRSRYEGNLRQRDEAYHQGTVWPWLIGPYAEAVLRVGRFSEASRREARAAIAPLIAFLRGDGLGQLHEVHDADPPHRPDGTPAQAWSVAALIRTLSLLGE